MINPATHRDVSRQAGNRAAHSTVAKTAALPCSVSTALAVILSILLVKPAQAQTAVPLSYGRTPVALTTTNTGSSATYVLNSDSSVGILQNGAVVSSIACPAFPAFASSGATISTGAIYFDPSAQNIYIASVANDSLDATLAYETLGSGGACTQSPVVQFSQMATVGLQMAVDPAQGNIYLAQTFEGGIPDRLYVASIGNLANYSSSSPVPYVQLDYGAFYGPMVLDSSAHRLYIVDFGPTQNSPPGAHASSGFFVYDPNQSATLSSNLGFIVGYLNSSSTAVPFYPDALLVSGRGELVLVNENAVAAADFSPGTPANLTAPLTILNTTAAGFSFFTCPQTGRSTGFVLGCYISPGAALSSISAVTPYTAMSAGDIDPANGIVYGYAYSATVPSSGILTPTTGSGLLLSYNLASGAETVLGNSLPFATLYRGNGPWNQVVFNPASASDDLVLYNSSGGLGVSAPLCSALPLGVDQLLGGGSTFLSLTQPALDYTNGYLYDIQAIYPTSALYSVAPPSSSCASISVPNVVGLTQTVASSTITGAGLFVGTVTTAASATVPVGVLISQSPTAGTSVSHGAAVNLVVSTGPAPPVAVISAAPSPAGVGTAVTLSGIGSSSATSIVSYAWTFGDGATSTTTTPTATHSYAKAGTFTATLVVTDSLGLVSAPASATVTVDAPPVAVITATPSPAGVGTAVTLSGIGSSSATSIVSYAWTFGDGATSTTTTPTATHSYSKAGTYTATLVVTDSLGLVSAPASASVTVETLPTSILVPDVVGLKRAAAEEAITGAGLIVGKVTKESSATVASGKVISESPAAGTSVGPGSAVDLVISTGEGYWLVASDGGIFDFGGAVFHGSLGAVHLGHPIVGMAATPNGRGYWLVDSGGGIFNFGNARFHGSTGAIRLANPIVGMAATPDGKGYWLVDSGGGIFYFGDATFHGSLGAVPLGKPIVGMAATPDGKGYWLVDSAGGVYNFGDAGFHGSLGSVPLAHPIVGVATTPDGKGYWLVDSGGGIFNFGDAAFHGSLGGVHLSKPIVGMAASPDGKGYWLADSAGGVFNFGDAAFHGSLGGVHLASPIVGIVSVP